MGGPPRAQIYPPKRTYQVCSTLDLFEWREVFSLAHSELEPLGATQTVEPSTVYYYNSTWLLLFAQSFSGNVFLW